MALSLFLSPLSPLCFSDPLEAFQLPRSAISNGCRTQRPWAPMPFAIACCTHAFSWFGAFSAGSAAGRAQFTKLTMDQEKPTASPRFPLLSVFASPIAAGACLMPARDPSWRQDRVKRQARDGAKATDKKRKDRAAIVCSLLFRLCIYAWKK